MPKLVIENLGVRYGRIVGTDGVSLALEAGETLALVGSNGAGKSSTLKAILGMVDYPQGRIALDGKELKGLKPSQIVRLGVGYSPEGRRVFPQLSVVDNLKVGGITREPGEWSAQIDKMYGYFPRLKERASQRAGSLSGGEQQMLAIGRALMARPNILLLDEPSMGLAPLLVREIFNVITYLNRENGTTILLVEQNAQMALKVAHRAYVLQSGVVTHADSAENLQHDEAIIEAYLGG